MSSSPELQVRQLSADVSQVEQLELHAWQPTVELAKYVPSEQAVQTDIACTASRTTSETLSTIFMSSQLN